MNNENRPALEFRIGEHYHYCTQDYVVISITGDIIQLRSLRQSKDIVLHSYKTLSLAFKRGNLYKIQEAPFLGGTNKILEGLSEKSRNQLDKRLAYVKECIKNLNGQLPVEKTLNIIKEVAKRIGDAKPPCYLSVYKWRKIFLYSGENPFALLSNKSKNRKHRKLRQPEAIQDIIDYYVDLLYFTSPPRNKRATIETIQLRIEDLNKSRPLSDQLVVPSESTLYRILSELDTFETEEHQLGLAAALKNQGWSKKFRKIPRLLLRVECDTHDIDIIIVDRDGNTLGRPWLTIVLDVCSRRVIGWDISMNPPSIEKTIRAIKMSLSSAYERNGLALLYVMDNGSEFIAIKLKICLRELGSFVTYCEPKNPNQKPHVERWFKTLITSLTHHMKGTTYSNPEERGDYDSEGEAIFTLEQVKVIFKDWLDSVYHSDYHSALNTSPDIFWDTHIDPVFPPKRFSDEDLRRLFLSKTYATPTNGRIGLLGLQWTGPGVAYLSTLKKSPRPRKRRKQITQPVEKKFKPSLILYYDPSELGTAWVCHPDAPDDIYEIQAVDPDYQTGLTMHMHELVREEFAAQKRKFNFKTARDNRVRINLALASAKGKSARKRKARLEEDGSIPPSQLSSKNEPEAKQEHTTPIDPAKYLINSQAPELTQVIEVKNELNRREGPEV